MDSCNECDTKTEKKMRFINLWNTFKNYSILIGKYSEFVRAFARTKDPLHDKQYLWANPGLHDEFMRTYERDVREICGEWFGTNPDDPRHPIMDAIFKRRGTRNG